MITKKETTNIRFLAHGHYSSISSCRTKILAIFQGIFIIFCIASYSKVKWPGREADCSTQSGASDTTVEFFRLLGYYAA
jgi:hypothetical protein